MAGEGGGGDYCKKMAGEGGVNREVDSQRLKVISPDCKLGSFVCQYVHARIGLELSPPTPTTPTPTPSPPPQVALLSCIWHLHDLAAVSGRPVLLRLNDLRPSVFGCQPTASIPPQVSREESLRPLA